MAGHSKIEWTDATWNPMTGCTPVSEACEHCYAERMSRRFHKWAVETGETCAPGVEPVSHAEHVASGAHFTPRFYPNRLDIPLHWRKPRRIFVCSMSDLFHEAFTDEQIEAVLRVMVKAPQHTYLVLTKRPERMRDFVSRLSKRMLAYEQANWAPPQDGDYAANDPLPENLWLGVTVENQPRADERIQILLDTPAAVRFLSYEPALGPVDLNAAWPGTVHKSDFINQLHWVIVGGETGPGARPMQPEWALDVYRQCKAAGVPYFFKRWGTASLDISISVDAMPELQAMEQTREFPAVSP